MRPLCSHVVVVGMPALRMRQGEPVDEIRQFTVVAWPEQQMPVVRHHAVRQQAHAGHMVERFARDPLEGVVIALLLEDGQAGVGPVEHMIHIATTIETMRSSHRGQV
jgi:hypothetical protein